MNHHRRSISLVLAPLLLLLLGARGVPSTEEIRQMLAEKQYKRVLREVARAVALRGDDALGYDRGALLLIRGEAQLGLRIEPGAAKSFRDAAEAATDAGDRATARATGLLMLKSERLVYKPRTGDASGREIDIVSDRKAALAALLADELAAVEPRAAAATRGKKTIAELLEAVTAVEPVAALERAATGAQVRTGELLSGFAEQIETLLHEALIESDRRADDIEQRALGLIAVPQEVAEGAPPPATIRVKKRGLARGDEAALREIMERCREVVSRSGDVAIQLGVAPDRFRRASDYAIRLSSKAGAILRADYTGMQEEPNPGVTPARVESSGNVEVSP